MGYSNTDVQAIADLLVPRAKQGDTTVMRSAELKSLFDQLKTLAPEERSAFGQQVNTLRQELEGVLSTGAVVADVRMPIDVTAPWDANTSASSRPSLLPAMQGSVHPLMSELETILDIYYRMGFAAVESRQLDDDYHMFESLNFPEGHPARDRKSVG